MLTSSLILVSYLRDLSIGFEASLNIYIQDVMAFSQLSRMPGVIGAMLRALALESVLLGTLAMTWRMRSSGSSLVVKVMVLLIPLHLAMMHTVDIVMLCSRLPRPVLGSRYGFCGSI